MCITGWKRKYNNNILKYCNKIKGSKEHNDFLLPITDVLCF